jgi:AraC family ethanolamine operon transcriptional activator
VAGAHVRIHRWNESPGAVARTDFALTTFFEARVSKLNMVGPAESLQLPGIVLIEKLLRFCRMRVTGLQYGRLSGAFGGYRHAQSTFSSMVADFDLHVRFEVPAGHYLTCYFHEPAPGSWCAGKDLVQDAVLVALPGAACEVMLGAGSRVSIATSPLHGGVDWALGRSATSFGLASRSYALFHPQQHEGSALKALYEELSSGLLGRSGVSAFARLESEAMPFLSGEHCLEALLSRASPPEWTSGYRSDYPVLRRASEYMRAHLADDVYMRDVAAAVQVSERRLYKVFEGLLRVSPARYLSLLRLHEAACRLSSPKGGRLSVKSVALDCGYRHLSRFAAHYHRLFGEYPSMTLARVGNFM